MALVNLKTILAHASENGYAVGAFNVINDIFLEGIIEAAEATQSPVILNIAEVHLPYVTLENICPTIIRLAEKSNVPVCLNFDHGLTMDNIKRAIDNGFTSIMFDGSHYDLKENIERTKQVVELCHPKNISVEAELGAVGGDEGGKLLGSADPSKYTDLNQAVEFVRATNVDALAVAIGNSHGKYKGEPDLDFERLSILNKTLNIPLVLHGGSGISDDDFRKGIQLGIAKINYFTGMSEAALRSVENFMKEDLGNYNNFLLLMEQVKMSVKADVENQMRIFGSISKV